MKNRLTITKVYDEFNLDLNTLEISYGEAKKFLNHIPVIIEEKLLIMDAINLFIYKISEYFNDYCLKLNEIASEEAQISEENENIENENNDEPEFE